jgi:hypothetical protein
MEQKESWWRDRGDELVELFKKGFPYIVLVLGIVMVCLGMGKVFTIDKVNDTVASLGKVFVGSGLFTFMIKSFQYTGIFKEELTKVIFEPRFLKNRNDLPLYWEKVSKELFKNTFPKISDKITKDVKETYLPTETIQYYDDVKHTIDIEMIDEVNEIVKVRDTVKISLHPREQKKAFPHSYRNTIRCLENDPNTKLSVVSFKVDGVEYVGGSPNKFTFNQKWENGNLTTLYEVMLNEGMIYEVEKVIEKTYSLRTDNLIFVKNDCIRNNVNVQIFYKGVKIEFYDIGTLCKFDKVLERTGYMEMHYNGIVYPKQGYLVIMKKA